MSVNADTVFPRLARLWSGTWRLILVLFIGLAAFALTYGMIVMDALPDGPHDAELGLRILADLALGVIAIALYPFRHRAPLLLSILIVASTAVSMLATGAALFALVSLSTRRRVREIIPVAVLSTMSNVVVEMTLPQNEASPLWLSALMSALVTAALVLTGLYIGGRRQLHIALREQVDSERRERTAHVEQARASERTRIAREMHDTLAHRLSLVSLHAGALEVRTDLSREQITQTAGTVRENARLAGEELREILGILRDPAGGPADSSRMLQPSLRNLEELRAESERAGNPVDLTVESQVAPLWDEPSETLSRTVFRVIQEAVTNARKHAPHSRVSIRVHGQPGEHLILTISNPIRAARAGDIENAAGVESGEATLLSAPASGLGLVGLAERVRLVGGTLEVSSPANGSFALTVLFPWKT